MANFIKVIFFLVIIAGIGIYLLSNQPEIFQGSPGEKILPPAAKYIAPSAPALVSPAPVSPESVISPEIPTIPAIPDYLIPSGFTRSQLSPYFGKIMISVPYASFYNYNPSEIKIYSNLSNNEKVNVTGWQIKTNNGEIIVPQAVNVYEPSGLALSEDVVILGNSNISIYSNTNPLNRNLRLNKCIGYLGNSYIFFPPLPKNCPTISHSDVSYLSGQCQSYIFSLWGCEEPDVSFYNSLPGIGEGNTCRQFLDTINYKGCFQKHRLDSNFLSNEWRMWLGWGIQPILNPQHDRVLLFDKQGLLVDEYIY